MARTSTTRTKRQKDPASSKKTIQESITKTDPLVSEETLGKALKLGGELMVPGFSQYADREFGQGLVHTGIAIVAKVAIGPAGFFLAAANSFTKSLTGKHLHEYLLQE